jgi:hypothetical protein
MGFNGCILPSVKSMQEHIQRDGLEVFVKHYKKYDSIMGETDRMRFLEEKVKEYQDKINYTPMI